MTKAKRRAAGAKGGRSRSKAKAKAARANGKAGGRSRDRLPPEVVARIGEPPLGDEKKLRTWNASLLAQVLYLQLRGEVGGELAASIRAGVASLDRVLPAPPPADEDEDDDDEDDRGEGQPEVPVAPARRPLSAPPR